MLRKKRLESTRLKASDPVAPTVEEETGAAIKGSITLADLLRRPAMHAADLVRHGLADGALPLPVREGAEIDIKYSGYLQRPATTNRPGEAPKPTQTAKRFELRQHRNPLQ
jgi:tRNA uridine 5-carboxymethylaminomethyl modification enzyme